MHIMEHEHITVVWENNVVERHQNKLKIKGPHNRISDFKSTLAKFLMFYLLKLRKRFFSKRSVFCSSLESI